MRNVLKLCMVGGLLLSFLVGGVQPVQAQNNRILTVGDSLTDEELQKTKDVLGATDITDDLTLRVKGSNIDYYTQNGSTDESIVVSSALVEFKEEGYGVVVEILTPENITEVKEETYQNAAVTAGGNDLHIKIANVTFPVNGRGALAGIYLTMDLMGGGVNLEDIAIAEQELALLQEILLRDSDIDPETLNKLLAVLKKDVAEDVQAGRTITQQRLDEIIDLRLAEFEIELGDDTRQDLLAIILNFSNTDAAKDEDLIETLDLMTGDLLKQSGEAINELPDQLAVSEEQGSNNPLKNPVIIAIIFILLGLGVAGVLVYRIKQSKQPKSTTNKKQTKKASRRKK